MFTDNLKYKDWLNFKSLETQGYFIDFIPGDKNSLVVTFENAHNDEKPRMDKFRLPWGAKFLNGMGYSVLGVKPKRVDWYRGKDLHGFFMSTEFSIFSSSFQNVFFYGSSMGGYGALAFSSSCPGSTVVAFSPQSTLDTTLVPWESRFSKGRDQDWSGYFSDAKNEISKASKIFIAFDPLHKLDSWHVSRLESHRAVYLKMPAVGHVVSKRMSEAGILKDFVAQALQGTLDKNKCSLMARSRKNIAQYYLTLGLLRPCAAASSICLSRLLEMESGREGSVAPEDFHSIVKMFGRSKNINFIDNETFLKIMSRASDGSVLSILKSASVMGYVDRSLMLTKRFVEQGRQTWRFYAHLSECEMKMGNLSSAHSYAGEAVARAPQEARAYRVLSRVCFSLGDIASAIDYGKVATTLEPGNFLGWMDLSSFYLKTEEVHKARESLMAALKVNPHSALAHSRLRAIAT